MVNFKKLRDSKSKTTITNPIEIFRRLPPPPGFFDLSSAQKEMLENWYKRRTEQDIVIKLHTGGGKTLIGLLIAQSIMNETQEPVIYLSPNRQLVKQTLDKAKEHSIPAVEYETGRGKYFSHTFLAGESVLVCTYEALFNGKSRFGAPGSTRETLNLGGIILDDAHVAFTNIRDSFTLRIEKSQDEKAYISFANMFRDDFKQLDKLGTFDAIVAGEDYNILEVPYWSWQAKSVPVHEYLKTKSEKHIFSWPLIRDSLDYCHALISKDAIAITSIYPLVDLIPSFSNCLRRIFMSATIPDDSELIRTFNAKKEAVSTPIISDSVAGISERMVLVPELMNLGILDVSQMLQQIAEAATDQKISTVILVPSEYSSKSWQKIATYANSPDKVEEYVDALQQGNTHGPIVLANRYDGIDLPGDACRLLIFSELPRGVNEYEQYRNNTFLGGVALNNNLAQRIEQGMGRAARGSGDYCVVLLAGKNLVSWIGRTKNTKHLTSGTRAQLRMGMDISKNVTDTDGLIETINSCFKRDKDWIEYHAETLAELIEPEQIDHDALELADIERKSFRLWRDGYNEKAISKLDKFCENSEHIDTQTKGWLYQFSARITHYWGRRDKAQDYQKHAFAENRNLMRPQTAPPYTPLVQPGSQSEAIAKQINAFFPLRGFLAEFDKVISHLVPTASANQFEEALKIFGAMLGFTTERPEKTFKDGPDVLWVIRDRFCLVIEAKSRKKHKNAFTKEQHGQLLVSVEWFQKEYPNYEYIPVSVQPSNLATKNAVAETSQVLTYANLNKLIADSRQFFVTLIEAVAFEDDLAMRCENFLRETSLTPKQLANHYLESFVVNQN